MSLTEVTWTPDFVETHEYYDTDGKEHLIHNSIGEYLDDMLVCSGETEATVDSMLEDDAHFVVFGFERKKPTVSQCEFLDDLIDNVDEEYGDPDDSNAGARMTSDEFAELKDLESRFIARFIELYKPWACDPVVKINVPFRAWFESLSETDQKSLREAMGEEKAEA